MATPLSETGAISLRLRQQRERLSLELLVQKLKKRLLVVLPLKAVFGMADLEAFQVNLTDESLLAIRVAGAEDELRTVRLIETAFNQPLSPE